MRNLSLDSMERVQPTVSGRAVHWNGVEVITLLVVAGAVLWDILWFKRS